MHTGPQAVLAGSTSEFNQNTAGVLARVKRGAEARALPLFHLSNSYLAVLFVGVAVDARVR